jgi:hypothetical protein
MSEEERAAQEKFREAPEPWLGRFGEAFWSKVFIASKIQYIPLCKIENGGAPMMEGEERMILPDFDLVGIAYVDSKVKSQSVIWRKTGQERHGIDKPNWEHYKRVAAAGRKNAGIALIELYRDTVPREWSGSLLVETLAALGEPIQGMSHQSHMLYWPRKRFVDLDSLSASELLAIANGRLRAAYPVELQGIFSFTPTTQMELPL